MGRICACLLVCLTLFSQTAQAQRVALVLGTDAYDSVQPLRNAGNDARDVAASLTRLGFEVELVVDGTAARIEQALAAVDRKLQGQSETLLFYFSGHAFQLEGANYLVPKDARLSARDQIAANTFRLDDIIERFQSADRQTLVFLDACRNNPLPLSVRGQDRDGLAEVRKGTNTYISFATQPGSVTRDGRPEDRNSPFTAALLRHIETAGHSVSDLMILVRNDVLGASGETQEPWDQSSLRTQFYFKPVQEKRPEMSDADLQNIGALDAASRQLLLTALAANGILLDVLDAPEPAPVAPAPVVARLDISDPDAPDIASPPPGSGLAPGLEVIDVATGMTIAQPLARQTVADRVQPATAAAAGAAPAVAGTPADQALDMAALSNLRTLDIVPQAPDAARIQGQTASDADLAQLALLVPPPDLPRALQSELARVGCHRGAIDGDWGRVSRVSLLRYLAVRGNITEAEAQANPTGVMYQRVRLEPGVVCTGSFAAVPTRDSPNRTVAKVVPRKPKGTPEKASVNRPKRVIAPTTVVTPDGTRKPRPGRLTGGPYR